MTARQFLIMSWFYRRSFIVCIIFLSGVKGFCNWQSAEPVLGMHISATAAVITLYWLLIFDTSLQALISCRLSLSRQSWRLQEAIWGGQGNWWPTDRQRQSPCKAWRKCRCCAIWLMFSTRKGSFIQLCCAIPKLWSWRRRTKLLWSHW